MHPEGISARCPTRRRRPGIRLRRLPIPAYLATRIDQLPLVVIVALRRSDSLEDHPLLSVLQQHPATTILRPECSTGDAVAQIVRVTFLDANDEYVDACYEVTGGNPFLLHELVRQTKEDGYGATEASAARLGHLVPSAIIDAVVARLGEMSHAERALAQAAAILGDRVSLHRAARLAELETRQA